MLNTVRIDVIKSKDSSWHLERVKSSLGNNTAEARNLASQINFPIEQKDSILALSRGFAITPDSTIPQSESITGDRNAGRKKNPDEQKSGRLQMVHREQKTLA